VLLVNGNLKLTGQFRFDGIVIVLGDLDGSSGVTEIYGGMITSKRTNNITFTGKGYITYSDEAIALANNSASRYVAFNGWQELAQ